METGRTLDAPRGSSYKDGLDRHDLVPPLESCPDRSLLARWRRGLVAVGLGRAFERIGGGLCRLSRIGGSVRRPIRGGGLPGGRRPWGGPGGGAGDGLAGR